MARGDTEFCRVEVDFILDDLRFTSLPNSAKVVYMTLWARSVKDRSERQTWSRLSADCLRAVHLKSKRLLSVVHRLSEAGLVTIDKENTVTVCGVRDKHKRLSGWKGDNISPYGESKGPIASP